MKATDKQVGGSHYSHYKIQPYEFFIVNKIPFHKADIIKRILRYDHETGKGMEDLDKIIHEIELIKELDTVLKDSEALSKHVTMLPPTDRKSDIIIEGILYKAKCNCFSGVCGTYNVNSDNKFPCCSVCGTALQMLD